MRPSHRPPRFATWTLSLFGAACNVPVNGTVPPPGASEAAEARIIVPRLWDSDALADWATPIVGPGVPPRIRSPEEYYAAPIDNLRTYPVHHPDFEPPGYLDQLRLEGPQPLIDPEQLHDRQDWIDAGQRVFDELDIPAARTQSAIAFEYLHDRDALAENETTVTKDGIIPGFRYVVDYDGKLKVTRSECASCHLQVLPDGTALRGAPGNLKGGGAALGAVLHQLAASFQERRIDLAEFNYLASAVPWLDPDPHLRLKHMTEEEVLELDHSIIPGTFARFNGSPYFMTKILDLRGIRDRRYFDVHGAFQNRDVADLARYAIWVSGVEDGTVGPHQVLTEEQRRLRFRYPDEALYALALYLYELEPAPSPFPQDALAQRGERVFAAEGCEVCHPSGSFTNDMLVSVDGFTPPPPDSAIGRRLHVMRGVRVGTDPGLALTTRKSTGYYKVPSLRGLWYRGLFEHSGSIATLEDWFDPRRLGNDYVPSGWKGPGVTHRAVIGHEYGLDLDAEDKRALIAFLKTL